MSRKNRTTYARQRSNVNGLDVELYKLTVSGTTATAVGTQGIVSSSFNAATNIFTTYFDHQESSSNIGFVLFQGSFDDGAGTSVSYPVTTSSIEYVKVSEDLTTVGAANITWGLEQITHDVSGALSTPLSSSFIAPDAHYGTINLVKLGQQR